jgi:hypothetical protein
MFNHKTLLMENLLQEIIIFQAIQLDYGVHIDPWRGTI